MGRLLRAPPRRRAGARASPRLPSSGQTTFSFLACCRGFGLSSEKKWSVAIVAAVTPERHLLPESRQVAAPAQEAQSVVDQRQAEDQCTPRHPDLTGSARHRRNVAGGRRRGVKRHAEQDGQDERAGEAAECGCSIRVLISSR